MEQQPYTTTAHSVTATTATANITATNIITSTSNLELPILHYDTMQCSEILHFY